MSEHVAAAEAGALLDLSDDLPANGGAPVPPWVETTLDDLDLAALEAEAEDRDAPSSTSWANARPDERRAILADAAEARRRLVAQTRTLRETFAEIGLTEEEIRAALAERGLIRYDLAPGASPTDWPELEDRGEAMLSELGDVEYVGDLIRPGRIVVVAAEEGTGKTIALHELGIRLAVAGGEWAGTWPILRNGPAVLMSEMHPDDDYLYEQMVLGALGIERSALRGRYFRLPLMTAAGGPPALMVDGWRDWIIGRLRDLGALLLVVDTATGATSVDPWGRAIQDVYRNLRRMLDAYPELAIILVVHLRKPNGKGERRITDVLGEWGRWSDVIVMLERDGLTRTKITTQKRVRRQRRIVATKRQGLLVDPIDLDEEKGTKVPIEAVVAAIEADPGMKTRALAKALEVSPSTAAKYAETAEEAGLIYRVDLGRGGDFGSIRPELRVDTRCPTVQRCPTCVLDTRWTVRKGVQAEGVSRCPPTL